MRRFLPLLLTLAALLLAACSDGSTAPDDGGDSGGNPPAPGDVDPFALNERIGRGINLGNALEAPNEGEWGLTLESGYFDAIRDAGFTSVRIPIRWSTHAGEGAPYRLDTDFLDRVNWAVDQALSRGLVAIINMHHYEELMSDPDNHEARFLGIWGQVADFFQDRPEELIFELCNEPNDRLTAARWNALLIQAIDVVRATNPGRTLMVGGPEWNGIGGLSQLNLPQDDANLIVTFHYYNPFNFTHQGAEWVDGADAWLGTTWSGTPAQRQAVIDDLNGAFLWGQQNARPLHLGEFGAYSRADMTSRALWTAFVARVAEGYGISWAYWEFGSGFGAYDPQMGAWRQPLLEALIPAAL